MFFNHILSNQFACLILDVDIMFEKMYLFFAEIMSISAEFKGVTLEAEQSGSIGAVAIILVAVFLVSIILLDLAKIYSDLLILKENLQDMLTSFGETYSYIKHRRKVTPRRSSKQTFKKTYSVSGFKTTENS